MQPSSDRILVGSSIGSTEGREGVTSLRRPAVQAAARADPAAAGGSTSAEVSREIQVAPPELGHWWREFMEGGQQDLQGKTGREAN